MEKQDQNNMRCVCTTQCECTFQFESASHCGCSIKSGFNTESEDQKNKQLTNTMKALDNIEDSLDDMYFEKLHNKIMAKIEEVEIQPSASKKSSRNYLRAHWRGWLYHLGSLGLILKFRL